MTQHTVTALFDSRNDANVAIDRLVEAGIPRTAIRLLPENDFSRDSAASSYDASTDEKGFWASLSDLFFPDDDRYGYSEAMSRGDIMVTATVSDADVTRTEEILDSLGTVSLDDRMESWRASGWQGYEESTSSANYDSMSSASTDMASVDTEDDREVIPIVEEELRVGKRRESGGHVRVRSYTIETPVSEDVELRDETVEIERRSVDRPLTAGDEVFRDRVIEAEETIEEPIVDKRARVKEELVLKKNVDRRTQTVTDSVRSTEVDVEDDRTQRRSTGRR